MKTALVTGATSGIGEAIARILSQNNFNLVICGRRKERLIALQNELSTEVQIASFDVRDKQGAEDILNPILAKTPIDLLVNNAGNAHGLAPIQTGVPRNFLIRSVGPPRY